MSAVAKVVPASTSVLVVPDDGDELYPTLGPLVCDWMEDNLVFGPGDLRGEPLVLSDEQRAFIYRFYELIPEGEKNAGRRRFRRCALSLAKGQAKTELAALVAAAELHRDAPVRFDGWDGKGNPKGRPVKDPFVVLVAFTEEQSDELAYGALKAILELSPIAGDFDIGLERIVRSDGAGKAVSLAGSPSARDGARTTFSVHDETHWHTSDKLKKAHSVMLNNLAKRKIAEAWALEVTTAYEPGAGSIAEETMDYARAIRDGRAKDAGLFFYHRQASDDHDLSTEEGARAAVIEASGSTAAWRDIDGIVAIWADPTTDRKFWERVWCNRPVQSTRKAFDLQLFKSLAKPETRVPEGSLITIGFDGAQFRDATAIVATHVATGYQWLAGAWECPPGEEGKWKVPAPDVDECIADLFHRYNVWRMYADPPYWQSWISQWQGRYGDERVIEWWTNRRTQMSAALEAFDTAMREKRLIHDGHELLVRHIGNAHRHDLPHRDEEAKPRWIIRKDRADSPYKIDAAMAACLSWEARQDAVAAGAGAPGLLKGEWLKFWKTKPSGGNRYLVMRGPREKSDLTAAWIIELREDRAYYAVEFVRDRLNAAERCDLLFRLHRSHQPLRVGYTKSALELDRPHIREREDRENYRISIVELDESVAAVDRAKRLIPLLEAGRIVLPEKLDVKTASGAMLDMTKVFLSEYEAFPYATGFELLDALSRILDVNAEFPSPTVVKHPTVFPSDW